MAKKSVVEWILNQLEGYEYNRIKNKNSWADSIKHLEYIKEKAQEMHKEEIENAFFHGQINYYTYCYDNKGISISKEKYYQKNYLDNNEQPVSNSNDLSSPKTSDN